MSSSGDESPPPPPPPVPAPVVKTAPGEQQLAPPTTSSATSHLAAMAVGSSLLSKANASGPSGTTGGTATLLAGSAERASFHSAVADQSLIDEDSDASSERNATSPPPEGAGQPSSSVAGGGGDVGAHSSVFFLGDGEQLPRQHQQIGDDPTTIGQRAQPLGGVGPTSQTPTATNVTGAAVAAAPPSSERPIWSPPPPVMTSHSGQTSVLTPSDERPMTPSEERAISPNSIITMGDGSVRSDRGLVSAPSPQPAALPRREGSGLGSSSSRHRASAGTQTSLHHRPVYSLVFELIKYTYSLTLLLFCIVLVSAAVFTNQTSITSKSGFPSLVAFFGFWILIGWLSTLEGGQACLVGLQPIDKSRYAASHPLSVRCAQVAHRGDNIERFIVGRQFLVVLVIFGINAMGCAVEGASVLNLPRWVDYIFLESGLAMVMVTVVIGQLSAQINAANCMLDFINNLLMLFTTHVSLGMEFSGLLHAVYLVQKLFSKVTGTPIESKEPPRMGFRSKLFWAQVLMSCALLVFAIVVTFKALFHGQTEMWSGLPNFVAIILLLVLYVIAGAMEGTQIALFSVLNMSQEDLTAHPTAYKNCQLAFTGSNLQAFLIGRQICVTMCLFAIARITTIYVEVSEWNDDNLFGVSDGMQRFFNTGLLGALMTTILASLSWRIVSSAFPLAFLSNPFVTVVIRVCLLFEASGVCSSAWMLARLQKVMSAFQPDEVYLTGAPRHGSKPVTRRDRDIDLGLKVIKFLYSSALLVFSVTVVMAAIFTRQTTAAENGLHPIITFFAFWLLILWLSLMEGGQGCLVGLQPIDKGRYASTHPVSLECTELAHCGDNMERFIVGRQFLVVLVVFATNFMGSTVSGASVLNLPESMNDIFLETGLAMILVTIMVGQLAAQVNAATCMLDFVNNYFMLHTIYVSHLIEMSGLLHCVYLVQILFSKITRTPIKSNEPPRERRQIVFFWIRVAISCIALTFAFIVTLGALFKGQTTMWGAAVPNWVSVILLFVFMSIVGMMEGMQIALFSVVNMPEEEVSCHAIAHANCRLTFAGSNLQAFLIGRQICVTICMFVVARITTINIGEDDENIFGVPDGLQSFLNTGLVGALLTTIVASLSWRIIASTFPLAFLSNPLIYVIIRFCLIFEASGVCSAAWILAHLHKRIARFHPDEEYLVHSPDQSNVDSVDVDDQGKMSLSTTTQGTMT